MANSFSRSPPNWFRLVCALLILWGLAGCASLYMHFGVGPGPDASAYDRQLYDSLPTWFDFVYSGAIACGLAGAIALLLRRRIAVPLSAVSLVLVVIQFGWMFVATDIVAVKGAWVTYFPAVIFAVQAIQLIVANVAIGRGWLR